MGKRFDISEDSSERPENIFANKLSRLPFCRAPCLVFPACLALRLIYDLEDVSPCNLMNPDVLNSFANLFIMRVRGRNKASEANVKILIFHRKLRLSPLFSLKPSDNSLVIACIAREESARQAKAGQTEDELEMLE
jgi:hypothetical protein